MTLWVPVIETGPLANQVPEHFNNEFEQFFGFVSEKDCIKWIEENKEYFSPAELEGNIIPDWVDPENESYID